MFELRGFRPSLAGLGLALLAASATGAAEPAVTVDLNKLEPQPKSCLVDLVADNPLDAFQSFRVDLIVFGLDGVIARRMSVDLAPLRARRKTVKSFDLDGIACDGIASILVNDVLECRTSGPAVDDCFGLLAVTSHARASLTK